MHSAKPNLGNKFSHIRYYFLFLSSPVIGGPSDLQSLAPTSGIYWEGAAKIGNDGNVLTGRIDAFIGDSAGAVCQFYFDGKITGKKFEVNCGNFVDTGTVSGTVTILNDTSVFLKTKNDPGCSDRILDLVENGATFVLKSKLKIIQIRNVKSAKAYFYAKPDASTIRKAYLVNGDEAQVTDKRADWVRVTFKKTTGWMQETDLIQLHSRKKN